MFKNKKMLFVVIAIVIVLCILIVAINIYNQKKKEQFIQSETERVRQYSRINDFQKIEEVFYYLDTELISSERSDIENVDYLIKAYLKYDAEYEYKSYYDKLIQYSAYVLKYKNFYIKDDNKNINIFVLCNSEKQTVTTYFINDNEKYFEKADSEDDMKQFKKSEVISVETVSKQLNQLISNNWNTSNTDFGTKDSYYRNYDIYFDEGLEVRKVNGKVFNIIFTNKYPDEIIKGIVDNVKPKMLIVIDSLASKSIERISSTVQISDTGIVPGGGVGNAREELSQNTIGIPVIAIGVPMVVESAVLVNDCLDLFIGKLQNEAKSNDYLNNLKEQDNYEEIKESLNPSGYNMIVTPKEIDDLIENMKDVVARAINFAV